MKSDLDSLERMFKQVLKEAYSAKMYLKTNPKESLYFYLVPDEEAVFSGSLNSVDEHWSGSTFYQQYERITELQRPFNIEFVAARNDPDSIRGEKNRDINRRAHSVYMKYIEAHPDEDATATLIVYVGYEQVLSAMAKLTPEVRNGRMKSDLDSLERMFKQVLKEAAARKAVKNDTVTIGTQVPELGLKDLQGNVLELKSLRGKYVVLDFWGSWCTWCIKGFPKLKEYYAKYKDRLEIVGIDCNDTAEKWAAAVKKHNLPWQQVRSEDGITEDKFRIKGYPYKVLISPEGIVLNAYLGETADFYQYLDSAL
jgi:thiol-disulfide isomerase/thioredoxin